MQRNNRILEIDIYKGILIIFVVIGHTLQKSVVGHGGVIMNFIQAIQMPGFMLASGYLSSKKISDFKQLIERIGKSFLSYAVPFFSWFIFVDIILLGKYGSNIVQGLTDLLSHVDLGLWFLWIVFLLSCLSYICNYFISKGCIYKSIISIFLFFIFWILILCFMGIEFLGAKFVLYYSLFYGFGWLIKWTEKWWVNWWNKVSNIMLFISGIIFTYMMFNYNFFYCGYSIEETARRCIAGFLGNLILINICYRFPNQLRKFKFDWLGLYTLEIYVAHCHINNLKQEYELYTLFGLSTFLLNLFTIGVFTAIIIVFIKSVPLLSVLFFGKKEKKKLNNIASG